MKYWIYGLNSMGSTWYLGSKDAKECTVWTGAPTEMRAVYTDIESARKKVAELDEEFMFGTTRHHVERIGA